MKKFFRFTVITLLALFFVNSYGLPYEEAPPLPSGPVFDDTKTAGFEMVNYVTNRPAENTVHYRIQGVTKSGGAAFAQQINVLTQVCNQEAKLVTWAVKKADGSGFVLKNLREIAADYEANHPGWKVVGGINADQYYTLYGDKGHRDGSDYFFPQPYGCFIADGEKWFAVNARPYTNNGTYLAGFLNDGSTDQILEGRTHWGINDSSRFKLAGLYLSLYDGDSLLGKYVLENFNEPPGENESSLYAPIYQGIRVAPSPPIQGSNLFLVEAADLAYTSNSRTYTYKTNNAQNAFFGKGVISSTGTNAVLRKGQFAIDTRNPELLAALHVGARVVVQFEFEGKINEVEAATAYHQIMRKNDQDVASTSPYNVQRYPRSFFGRKADGTMVLVAVDGSQGTRGMYGTNQFEGCAVLKYLGVVEAYQMDGGGSVTMIVRRNNDFMVVNSPSDGRPRSVLSALLFVVRDTGSSEVSQKENRP